MSELSVASSKTRAPLESDTIKFPRFLRGIGTNQSVQRDAYDPGMRLFDQSKERHKVSELYAMFVRVVSSRCDYKETLIDVQTREITRQCKPPPSSNRAEIFPLQSQQHQE